MIKVTTTQAHAAEAARRRISVAGQCADAIDTMTAAVPPCKHQRGGELPKCPQCVRRQALRDAAAEVRKTGGVQ